MRNTRNSIITSTIALVLCISMLLGTTFAWFTDIAGSNDNVVQSGNLDAEMYWSDELLASDSDEWIDATGSAVFSHNAWEPGYTEVKYIKVYNNGSLNFKWQLSIEADGAVSDLSDVIHVYYVNPVTSEITTLAGLESAGTLTTVISQRTNTSGRLEPETAAILAIAFHMDKEAGNKYQNKTLCNEGFSLKLIATQDVGELDSFGPDYDNAATWPDGKMNFEAKKSLANVRMINDELADEVIITHETGAYAILPQGVKVKPGATELAFSGKNIASADANISDSKNDYDIHIEGIADDNTTCITVYIGEIFAKNLAPTSVKLYHEGVQMTRVNSVSDFAINNQYTYDPATGAVVLYVDNFSIFSAVEAAADEWDGKSDTAWYNENIAEFTLTTAEQFAGFRDLVDGGNTFAGKTVKLGVDIDLAHKLFDPIGYNYEHLGGKVFKGTFDGAGHTVYNLYQNGWDLDPDKENYSTYTYSTAGGGLFASIKDATVKNLVVSGANIVFECVDIGIVVGYAQGSCHFENIVVTDSKIANYNRATGGVVGEVCFGPYGTDIVNGYSHTFNNIVVDSSVKISSLWGSFDTLCGGVIGGKWGDATVKMTNVISAPELDVFSDVTAAYQWYAYRRCGMILGHTEQDSPKQSLNAAAPFLTCENVNVYYGSWANYTYYEYENQDNATGRNYPWVRAEAGEHNEAFSNPRYGVPTHNGVKVTGLANSTDHTPIVFNQLYGGGQGVYGRAEHAGVTSTYYTTDAEFTKTVYIQNNKGWNNLRLRYWFANGNDVWTTVSEEGVSMASMFTVEEFEGDMYKIVFPAYTYKFAIIADGNATSEKLLSELEDSKAYKLDWTHAHLFEGNECECGAINLGKKVQYYEQNIIKDENKGGIIFVGDSYFDGYTKNAPPFWSDFYQDFAGEKAFLMGISQSQIHDLEAVSERLVYPMEPNEIVVHIGFNDVHHGSLTTDELIARITALLEEYNRRLPEAKIYFMGVEPKKSGYTVGDQYYNSSNVKAPAVSEAMKALAEENDWLFYIDTVSIFVKNGTINESMYRVSDGSHPSLQAYDLMRVRLNAARGKTDDILVIENTVPEPGATTVDKVGREFKDKEGNNITGDFVMSGKLILTDFVRENAHLQFKVGGSVSGNTIARFLLWDANNDGKFGAGYQFNGDKNDTNGAPLYDANGVNLMLTWAMVAEGTEVRWYINGKCVQTFDNPTRDVVDISAYWMNVTLYDIELTVKAADGEDAYNEHLKPYSKDVINIQTIGKSNEEVPGGINGTGKTYELTKNSILSGKLDISEVYNNPHIQFHLDSDHRFLLWDSNNDGKIGVAYEEGGKHFSDQSPRITLYDLKNGITGLEWAIVADENNVHFFVNGKYEKTFESLASESFNLNIGALNMNALVYDIKVLSKAENEAEYNTECAKYIPYSLNIENSNGAISNINNSGKYFTNNKEHEDLTGNYIVKGTLTVNKITKDNAHIQFRFSHEYRFLLWDADNDGVFGAGYMMKGLTNVSDKTAGVKKYDFNSVTTLEWAIVVNNGVAYWYINDELVSEVHNANIKLEYFNIGALEVDVFFENIKIYSESDDADKYATELAKYSDINN